MTVDEILALGWSRPVVAVDVFPDRERARIIVSTHRIRDGERVECSVSESFTEKELRNPDCDMIDLHKRRLFDKLVSQLEDEDE